MFCPYCGNKIADDDLFCMKCGKKIPQHSQQSQNTEPPKQEETTPSQNIGSACKSCAENIGIGENISSSLKFGSNAMFRHFGRLLGLAFLNLIPIINWQTTGIMMKSLRNEEPAFFSKSEMESHTAFTDGVLLWVLTLVYSIIPAALYFLCYFTIGNSLATIVIVSIVIVAELIFFVPAIVNLARTGFWSAFKFRNLGNMIATYGVGKYLTSLLLLLIIYGLYVAIYVAILLSFAVSAPGVLAILVLILYILLIPWLIVTTMKFISNMFPPEEE